MQSQLLVITHLTFEFHEKYAGFKYGRDKWKIDRTAEIWVCQEVTFNAPHEQAIMRWFC